MNPITRKEMFLAAAGGQNVETPTPVTREEVFLDEIAKGGGGSSLPSTETASAGDVLSLDDNKEPQWAAPSGSGGGVLVVHETVSGTTHTLDKTAGEIINSLPCVYIDTVEEGEGYIQHDLKPLLYNQGGDNGQMWLYQDGMGYAFPITALGPDATYFVAATLNDYPSYT